MLLAKVRDEGNSVSVEAIHRVLFPDFSRWSEQKMMKKVGEKRKRFDEEPISLFQMVDLEAIRWEYTIEFLIEELRAWMVNNYHTRASPKLKHNVTKCDLFCDNEYDPFTKEPVRIQKVFVTARMHITFTLPVITVITLPFGPQQLFILLVKLSNYKELLHFTSNYLILLDFTSFDLGLKVTE